LLTQEGRLAAQLFQFGSLVAGHTRLVGCPKSFRTLGFAHFAPLPAPGVGAVTTSKLPAIQPLCAL
jgi:hypothetical protein